MPDRVIYIVRSWPRLSQTFIVNEVLALERRGLELVVFSLVRSGEDVVQPQVADVPAPIGLRELMRYGDVRGTGAKRLLIGDDVRAQLRGGGVAAPLEANARIRVMRFLEAEPAGRRERERRDEGDPWEWRSKRVARPTHP